ncbi:MAG: HEAT repeat domain-containing protein, partial [Deltaproteobacteria bacterium]
MADLVERLKDDDPTVRAQAATDLGGLGPKAEVAVPALIPLLGDTNSVELPVGAIYTTVRQDTANALVQIGPQAVPAVIDAMQHSANEEIRIGAAMTLIAFGPDAKEALPALARGLDDPIDTVRALAAQGLAGFRNLAAGHMDQLSKRLREDSSVGVRAQVAVAFRFVDPDGSRSVPELIHALGDKSPDVRSAAARMLGALGSKASAAVPALVARLNDRGTRLEMFTHDFFGPRAVSTDVS